MYYVIKDQNSLGIIYANKKPLQDDLKPEEVYKKFDPETMFFYKLADEEKIDNNMIVIKNEAEIIETKLAKNQIKTKDEALEGLRGVGRQIEKEVSDKFSIGYELKLTTDYLFWMIEGKPENDEREQKFLIFKKELEEIKEKYSNLRASLKKIAQL